MNATPEVVAVEWPDRLDDPRVFVTIRLSNGDVARTTVLADRMKSARPHWGQPVWTGALVASLRSEAPSGSDGASRGGGSPEGQSSEGRVDDGTR